MNEFFLRFRKNLDTETKPEVIRRTSQRGFVTSGLSLSSRCSPHYKTVMFHRHCRFRTVARKKKKKSYALEKCADFFFFFSLSESESRRLALDFLFQSGSSNVTICKFFSPKMAFLQS